MEIQQGWCKYWVRQQLAIKPSQSIIAFISDCLDCSGLSGSSSQKPLARLQDSLVDLRWQFRQPVFVLLSMAHLCSTAFRNYPAWHLQFDHIEVPRTPSDACGWLGASDSVLILECSGLSRSSIPPRNQSVLQTLQRICSGFSVPVNILDLHHQKADTTAQPLSSRFPQEASQYPTKELSWECLHQSAQSKRIDFRTAVELLAEQTDCYRDTLVEARNPDSRVRHAG